MCAFERSEKGMEFKMKLSILTATYNRANYLTKLYESIKENLKYNITPEWIIVDDGSTDETKNVVQGFIEENKIIIEYMYQKNSGKMSAINEAVKMATGDLIVDCDSDDIFTNNSLILYDSKLDNKIEDNYHFILSNYRIYSNVILSMCKESGDING